MPRKYSMPRFGFDSYAQTTRDALGRYTFGTTPRPDLISWAYAVGQRWHVWLRRLAAAERDNSIIESRIAALFVDTDRSEPQTEPLFTAVDWENLSLPFLD